MWLERWCHRLRHEGGEAVRQEHGKVMGYFGTRCTGWAIGSGPVESACQKVIGKRMNGDGMRRGEDEADALCHLLALYASGEKQYDAY